MNQQKSLPDRIRKVALDLTLARHLMEMELQAARLKEIADELERSTLQPPKK